ncbi:MAG: hypothetical protein ABIE36_02260 [Candidatus Diapherotrites archaeon]
MVKRGSIAFIFLIAFTTLLIGTVSSASCSVTTSCVAANTVMKLASTSNCDYWIEKENNQNNKFPKPLNSTPK